MNSDAVAADRPRPGLPELPLPALSLVTVVFEAELPLLELQARSLARFVPDDVFAEIIVIDNTRQGLSARRRPRLVRAYGRWHDRLRFIRPDDIGRLPAARGWVTQQALKLMVSASIDTPFFLVLDAKNHWIRATDTGAYLNEDGRSRGASHSYRGHALAGTLSRVLAYLDVDPEAWLDSFPVTHTPVVLETDVVRRLIADVEARGRPFADEFVTAGLTEFFLYAGWIIANYGTLDGHLDGSVVRSATVWPSESSTAAVERVLADATRLDAPFVSVHRTALARAGRKASGHLVDFWDERGLFRSRRDGMLFVTTFKAHYLVTMAMRKVRSKLGAPPR